MKHRDIRIAALQAPLHALTNLAADFWFIEALMV